MGSFIDKLVIFWSTKYGYILLGNKSHCGVLDGLPVGEKWRVPRSQLTIGPGSMGFSVAILRTSSRSFPNQWWYHSFNVHWFSDPYDPCMYGRLMRTQNWGFLLMVNGVQNHDHGIHTDPMIWDYHWFVIPAGSPRATPRTSWPCWVMPMTTTRSPCLGRPRQKLKGDSAFDAEPRRLKRLGMGCWVCVTSEAFHCSNELGGLWMELMDFPGMELLEPSKKWKCNFKWGFPARHDGVTSPSLMRFSLKPSSYILG